MENCIKGEEMKSIILATVTFGVLVSAPTLDYPKTIMTPEQISIWLQQNFTYKMDEIEHFKKPKDMIKDKIGDCEDFAFLTNAILNDLKIKNKVLAIGLFTDKDGNRSGHAICVFKYNGSWQFLDNQYYREVNYKSFYELIDKEYPIWYEIQELHLNGDRETLKRKKENNEKN